MFLLTTKPVLYVCNVDDVSAASGNQYVEQVRRSHQGRGCRTHHHLRPDRADIAELETYEKTDVPRRPGTERRLQPFD